MADYDINAVTRRVVYDGSSGLGPYAFSFEILATADITVYFNASVLTITTDYTVTINANGTGSINIVTGGVVPSTPVAADQITIVGARDIERTTDFVTAGDLRASALNEQLDGQIIMIQQVAEENARGMRAPVFDPALVEDGGVLDMTLPTKADRVGKYLAFDANGNPTSGPSTENVNTLASITDDIALLADIEDGTDATDAIQTVAGISSNVTSVANISSNVSTVAGISSDVTAVAGDASDIGTVSTNIANVNTVAGISSNVTTVATNIANVNAVGGDIANVNTVATNIVDVNSFAERYRVGSSDPTTSLDEGDLFFNTTSNEYKFYDGSAWQAVNVSGLGSVLEDTTPQLGGNLDLNSNNITGTGDIDITGGLTTTNNVGIGAASPSQLLTVAASGSSAKISITDTDTAASAMTGFLQFDGSDTRAGFVGFNGGNLALRTDSTDNIILSTDSTERMRIDSSGNVTINKTAVAGSQTASVTGSTTLDFGTYQNFILTLTGSITLANPSTEQVGQSGFITFIQTGGYTVSVAGQYETAGGAGITLSASGTDVVPYIVAAAGRILLGTPQLAFA